MDMSCTQTDTTLAWLYGEGDEAHLSHVGSCPTCQALVEDHEAVLAAVAPALPHVQQAPPSQATPEPAGRTGLVWALALVPLAAAALVFAMLPGAPPVSPPSPDSVLPVPVASLDLDSEFGDLDRGLDDLDSELDDLFVDLEAL